MAKDINIHVKTTGAERTQQQLDGVGAASQQVGAKTAAGGREAAPALDKTTEKLSVMGRVASSIKTQVMGLVGAFLGFQAVVKVVTYLIQSLERVQELQKKIYEQSVSLAELGRALEFQTGTQGKQRYWTEQAVSLQKAGGLPSPQVAQQMLVSMDIAFAAQGGIKDQQVLDLARQLAPFVGAAGLGPEEVSKVFEFAGAAGVAPTPEAYKDFLAKLQAGYTSSKATDFGQFMLGLQKGGTSYMTMGGTLPEAISQFAAARSVMPNEALAATLIEQLARVAGGAYEKPRVAMEESLGVKWDQLSMDQRTAAVLAHVAAIPEARRAQTLAEQGFPLELTTGIGKMVSPEAVRTKKATGRRVAESAAADIDRLMADYMASMLGEMKTGEAARTLGQVKAGPGFAAWQERLKDAQAKFEVLAAKGKDSLDILDFIEPRIMALESLLEDYAEFAAVAPESMQADLQDLISRLRGELKSMSRPGGEQIVSGFAARPERIGHEYSRALQALQKAAGEQPPALEPPPEQPGFELYQPPAPAPAGEQPAGPQASGVTIHNHYDSRQFFTPVVGVDPADLGIGGLPRGVA